VIFNTLIAAVYYADAVVKAQAALYKVELERQAEAQAKAHRMSQNHCQR